MNTGEHIGLVLWLGLLVSCGASPRSVARPPLRISASPPVDHARTERAVAAASRLGDELLAEGRLDEAIVEMRKAQSIADERLPNSLTAGITAAKLADALFDSGDHEGALAMYRKSIAILDRVLPHADPNLSLLIGEEIRCLLSLGQRDEAVQVTRALYARARAEGFTLPAQIVAVTHTTAKRLEEAGDLVDAALLFEDSLDVLRRMQGPDATTHQFMALSDVAELYEHADLPDQEAGTLRQMLAMQGLSAPQHCEALERLTDATLRDGRSAEGQKALDQAWPCLEPSDAEWIAWVSIQLSRLGQPGAGRRVIDRALAEKKFDASQQAKLLHSVAIAQMVDFEPCEGAETLRREVALLRPIADGKDALDQAHSLLRQASESCTNEHARGARRAGPSPDEARRSLAAAQEDLAKASQRYAPTSLSILARRLNVANAMLELRQDADACKELDGLAQNYAQAWLSTAAEASRASQVSEQGGFTPHAIDLVASACLGSSPSSLAEQLMFLKGQILEGVRQETILERLSGDPGRRELVLKLRAVRARIASALLAGRGTDAVVAEETTEKEQLERELASVGNDVTFVEPIGVIGGVTGLRRALNPDEAYVDLTAYRPVSSPGHEPRLLATVLTRDRAFASDLGPVKEIARARDGWLSSIADWHADGTKALARLRGVFMQPILSLLPAGVTHLVVTPDDALDGVPWHHPGLTDGRTVWVIPSAREFVRYKLLATPLTGSPLTKMTLVHAPDFDAGTGQLASPGKRLFPLPPEPTQWAPGGSNLIVDDLSGPRATQAALVASLAHAQLLHVVTHGVFMDDTQRRILTRNPFSSSAFALAGANRVDALGCSDGIVSAEELVGVAGEDLRVATLAMCDSAKGATVPGQGQLGLATALSTGGTPIVVASAWKASFESAARLFPAFYSALLSSKDPRVAFDDAIAAVRSDPALSGARHWAGWVFMGYMRPSTSPTLAMSRLVYQLCTCRSDNCGWHDSGKRQQLKQILATPHMSKEDEDVIAGLAVDLKQCVPDGTVK